MNRFRRAPQPQTRTAPVTIAAALTAAAAALMIAAPLQAQTSATAREVRAHVETLASPRLEGRLTGSAGEQLAA